MADDTDRPERPRVEPEIIPPGRRGPEADWRRFPWSGGFGQTQGTYRIHVTRFGPFAIALVILAIAAIVALFTIAVLGAVLIWVPIVIVAVIAGALLRLFRGFGAR